MAEDKGFAYDPILGIRLTEARTREERLGEFLHTCLYFLDHYDGMPDTLDRLIQKAKAYLGPTCLFLKEEDAKEIRMVLERALHAQPIGMLFKKGIRNLREREFLDESGNTIRIDRINFYPEGLIEVIDFKYKYPESNKIINEYKKQLNNYVNIVQKVFSAECKGILVFLATCKVHEIFRQ